jgi:hypothetical protein
MKHALSSSGEICLFALHRQQRFLTLSCTVRGSMEMAQQKGNPKGLADMAMAQPRSIR